MKKEEYKIYCEKLEKKIEILEKENCELLNIKTELDNNVYANNKLTLDNIMLKEQLEQEVKNNRLNINTIDNLTMQLDTLKQTLDYLTRNN